MKILAISDIHGKKSEKLLNYIKNEDIQSVLIAGDITDFGITEFEPLSFVKPFIDEIVDLDVDVFAIPGNCDPAGICNAIKESGPDERPAFCLHNQLIAYENVVIMGYGGSNPTPFDTPGEIDDDKIYERVYELLAEYDYIGNDSIPRVTILLTHAPPYDTTADTIESGAHVGSQGVKKPIHEFQPNINICGHVHEAASIDKVGKTTIANPGALEFGKAVLIEVDEEANYTVDLIEL
ncbi:metallophosphoesterase [uncultured Methanobrevibacter sp.]|uniref:metallophosphoesterase family protein n=1 Tax=uncultured Methanobrevibacter sp. TaxID=253161 RepID=UPI00261C3869